MPIGFLIQNEKRELHKINSGVQNMLAKSRPDSAHIPHDTSVNETILNNQEVIM